MAIRLNEDELSIYIKAEKRIVSLVNDFIDAHLDDIVYEELADHPWVNESDMPPGSTGVDAAADRIMHNLRNTLHYEL